MFFLVTYTRGTLIKSWQETKDMCTASGTTLPIPRSEAEVHELCDVHVTRLSKMEEVYEGRLYMKNMGHMGYVWTGIIEGAEPNSYKSYFDQSSVLYTNLRPYNEYMDGKCMAVDCWNTWISRYKFRYLPCTQNIINFCEEPRKYPSENLIDTLYRKSFYFDG